MSKPILVAVCGNSMAGDDAFGPLVAAVLNTKPLPHTEVLDLGLNPTSLVHHLEDRQTLFVVDAAVCTGFRAGQLIDVDWFNARGFSFLADRNLSTHGLSIDQQLRLAETMNQLPPMVRLIALVVPDAGCGRIPRRMLLCLRAQRAVDQIRRHVKQWTMTHRAGCWL